MLLLTYLLTYLLVRVGCDSDTLIVVALDAVTSIFAGFAIFSIIGHLAHTLNTSVDKVAASGENFVIPASVTAVRRLKLCGSLRYC